MSLPQVIIYCGQVPNAQRNGKMYLGNGRYLINSSMVDAQVGVLSYPQYFLALVNGILLYIFSHDVTAKHFDFRHQKPQTFFSHRAVTDFYQIKHALQCTCRKMRKIDLI